MPTRLTFHGAAREVTGSCYHVEHEGVRFLVDCGLFQGGRESDGKNRSALDFDAEALDFVLLTHAHIDHSGLLPRLVTAGFRGTIYCTSATADLITILLPDSAHIQEKEAEWQNWRRRGKKKKKGQREFVPLYTVVQAQDCLRQVKAVGYDEDVHPHPQVRCRFREAGHILGSASIEIWLSGGRRPMKLVFSGDLGQKGAPIVRDPARLTEADYVITESTYGNRLHKSREETLNELVHALTDTLERKGGNVVIPAFSVGRTQDLLFLFHELHKAGRIGRLNVFVDSPLSLKATQITFRHGEALDEETLAMLQDVRKRHNGVNTTFIQTVEESIGLNSIKSGAVIISASGMAEAGRIKHHLRQNLPRRECSIIIVGFQAAGTVGRRLVDGVKSVRLFGEDVPVRAGIHTIGGLSAHADRDGLLDWLGAFRQPPQKLFVCHGEQGTADLYADTVRHRLGWTVHVPGRGETVTLS